MGAEEETRELVEKAQAGDRAAFDALADCHRARLRSVVDRRLGPKLRGLVAAEDVLQETFLRAWRSLARFQPQDHGSFSRWLGGIAVNVILETAHRPEQDRYLSLTADFPTGAPSPSKTLQREERLERLEKALAGLSPEQRQAVVLVRLEGLSVTEAARRMDRSPNAVSLLLLRALRKLRETVPDTESFTLPDRRLDLKEARDDG